MVCLDIYKQVDLIFFFWKLTWMMWLVWILNSLCTFYSYSFKNSLQFVILTFVYMIKSYQQIFQYITFLILWCLFLYFLWASLMYSHHDIPWYIYRSFFKIFSIFLISSAPFLSCFFFKISFRLACCIYFALYTFPYLYIFFNKYKFSDFSYSVPSHSCLFLYFLGASLMHSLIMIYIHISIKVLQYICWHAKSHEVGI